MLDGPMMVRGRSGDPGHYVGSANRRPKAACLARARATIASSFGSATVTVRDRRRLEPTVRARSV
jgi:hypothetical protein